MALTVEEADLKQGLLGLAVALIEVICDALRLQAWRRITSGNLAASDCERLEQALEDIDDAIRGLKADPGVARAAASLRAQLDHLVEDVFSWGRAE